MSALGRCTGATGRHILVLDARWAPVGIVTPRDVDRALHLAGLGGAGSLAPVDRG